MATIQWLKVVLAKVPRETVRAQLMLGMSLLDRAQVQANGDSYRAPATARAVLPLLFLHAHSGKSGKEDCQLWQVHQHMHAFEKTALQINLHGQVH